MINTGGIHVDNGSAKYQRQQYYGLAHTDT